MEGCHYSNSSLTRKNAIEMYALTIFVDSSDCLLHIPMTSGAWISQRHQGFHYQGIKACNKSSMSLINPKNNEMRFSE